MPEARLSKGERGGVASNWQCTCSRGERENGDAKLGVSVFERIAGCALLAGSGLGVYRILC
jgi:hypothetical protein